MLDIKKEIQVLIVRNGLSMRKLIKRMQELELTNVQIASFSRMLKEKTIKFELVQDVLDFLGYELEIKKKNQ